MNRYGLKRTLANNRSVDLDDVYMVKSALQQGGFYESDHEQITPYPDEQLFQGIREFQRARDLKVDGLMRPDGPTENAMSDLLAASATYFCTICGAPHGGVFSPNVCWQCWNKGYR